MDYKETYEKAIERIGKYTTDKDGWARVKPEEIFPELKESKDERVRKHLLKLTERCPDDSIDFMNGVKKEDVIAWLEKQGSQNLANSAKTCEVEQKPTDKVEPKFKVGDNIIAKPETCMEHIPFHITSIKDGFYWDGDDSILIDNQDNFVLVGKAVKEPAHKFKVGDWIIDVQGVSANQIIGYEDDSYLIETSCSKFYLPMKLAEKNYRLWTIQDAKDGDVLVASDGSIFLFKGVVDDICKHYVVLTTNNVIRINEGLKHCWEISRAVHPATKEQRSLLFQKIKEAGYKWDAELNVLEEYVLTRQKPDAWSEEDERMYKAISIALSLKDAKGYLRSWYTTPGEADNWLKSLKDRLIWKPSDEQMEALDDFIYAKYPNTEKHGAAVKSLYQDLKKLKEE